MEIAALLTVHTGARHLCRQHGGNSWGNWKQFRSSFYLWKEVGDHEVNSNIFTGIASFRGPVDEGWAGGKSGPPGKSLGDLQ